MAMDIIQLALDNIKKARSAKKLIVFTVASTGKQESDPYMTPLREYDDFCVMGCVIFNQTLLLELISSIDSLVDMVLVDAEKKVPLLQSADICQNSSSVSTIGNFETGNFSKICFANFKAAKVFEYKPNDLSVNAAWMFLSQKLKSFTGKKISILGVGNIGSKLALKLVECGADVHVYSRDYFKTHLITQALNLIKPVGTIASITCHREILPTAFMSDVLVGATNGVPIISSEIISSVKKSCLIMDLGKNNLTESAISFVKESGLEICRTDVTSSLETFVTETLSLNDALENNYGERTVSGRVLVSGGFFGQSGAIIVDSVRSPTQIFGVADGFGSLKKELTESDNENIRFLSSYFDFEK